MCLKEELIPKDLFPISNSIGTINPIKGPAMYQGHGSNIQFISFSLMQSYDLSHDLFVTFDTEGEKIDGVF